MKEKENSRNINIKKTQRPIQNRTKTVDKRPKLNKKINRKIIIYIIAFLIVIYVIYTIFMLLKQPTNKVTVDQGTYI